MLRKGLSLTQIYTQLVEITRELSLEREENERLKVEMEVIHRELKERAPLVQQQRQDYEAALNNVATLTSRLDELLVENQRLHEKADEANRLAKHHTQENQRLKTELADLARQVNYILLVSYFSIQLIVQYNKYLKMISIYIKSILIFIKRFFFSGVLSSQRSSRKSYRYSRIGE